MNQYAKNDRMALNQEIGNGAVRFQSGQLFVVVKANKTKVHLLAIDEEGSMLTNGSLVLSPDQIETLMRRI